MDPLVRVALGVQHGLARASGIAICLGLGTLLVFRQAGSLAPFWDLGICVVLAASLTYRVIVRFRSLQPDAKARVDLELFAHLVVAVEMALQTFGGLASPVSAVIYVVLMLAAAFARPAASLGTLLFTMLLETGLHLVPESGLGWTHLWPRLGLCVVFTGLNLWVFRAEITRVRRLSRAHVDAELKKVKEAARSYRLLGAPGGALERGPSTLRDGERAMHSGVEEIRAAQQFGLELLRRSLGLRTALLLWLDATGNRLHIQEASTLEGALNPGPFNAKDGIIGAALAQGKPVSLEGPRAARHIPYYVGPAAIGAVSAVPVLERGMPRGVLVVDRLEDRPFRAADEELLLAATRFILRAIDNERVFIQLERSKQEQGKLYRAVDRLAAATSEAQVIEAAVNSAREFAAFDFAVVTLFDRTRGEHEIRAASGEGTELLVGRRYAQNQGLVSMVVANRHPLPYRGEHEPMRQMVFARGIDAPPLPSLLVLPLLVHERALGTLVLGSKRKSAFGEAVRTTLEVLASHLAVSLDNARLLKRLEELATIDGLTGLLNKRAFLESAQQKLRSAQRFGKSVSMLVCDIDFFKKVNDTYGHDVGDVVIRGFADVLRQIKRDIDIVGRFGGEEFVILCEETSEQGAVQLAERIREGLEAARFTCDKGAVQVTCSVGVAGFPVAGQDWDSLFKSTDEALYASKRGGRNRVTLWTTRLQGQAA